jgi:hypothetical protein
MTDTANRWSPADNPYAIAVSEAQWWERTAQLALRRLGDPDDDRISWLSSRQIDARQLIFALQQLLTAERLQQAALEELDIDQDVRDELDAARHAFEHALPGIKHMRDALVHFEDWSRGKGRGPQEQRVLAGTPLREAATEFWGFEYDPTVGTISLGSYTISGSGCGLAQRSPYAVQGRRCPQCRGHFVQQAGCTAPREPRTRPQALVLVTRS